MKTQYHLPQNGDFDPGTVDFDAHYKIGKVAVAWHLLGFAVKSVEQTCFVIDEESGDEIEVLSGECELEPDFDYVIAVMVGDDRRETIHISNLELIPEKSFCRSCGQIGCGCNVYE